MVIAASGIILPVTPATSSGRARLRDIGIVRDLNVVSGGSQSLCASVASTLVRYVIHPVMVMPNAHRANHPSRKMTSFETVCSMCRYVRSSGKSSTKGLIIFNFRSGSPAYPTDSHRLTECDQGFLRRLVFGSTFCRGNPDTL